jgi:hypothetical protein
MRLAIIQIIHHLRSASCALRYRGAFISLATIGGIRSGTQSAALANGFNSMRFAAKPVRLQHRARPSTSLRRAISLVANGSLGGEPSPVSSFVTSRGAAPQKPKIVPGQFADSRVHGISINNTAFQKATDNCLCRFRERG